MTMKLDLFAYNDLLAEETLVNQLGKMESSWQEMLHQCGQCEHVKVISGESEMMAHKALISLRIPYFKDAILHDSKRENKLEIPPEISPDTVKLIVNYAYFVQPTITIRNAQDLLEAAAFFRIEDIWKFCDRFIAERVVLRLENCIDVKNYAVVRSAKQLATTVKHFISENLADLFKSEGFKMMSCKEVEFLLSLDGADGLPTENIFWEGLVQWVGADERKRKKMMPQLMKLLRLPCLSARYITNNILAHPFVDNNPKCRQLLHTLMRFKVDPHNLECRLACADEFELNKRSGSQKVSYVYVFTSPDGQCLGNAYSWQIPDGYWEKIVGMDYPSRWGLPTICQAVVRNNRLYCTTMDKEIAVYNLITKAWIKFEYDKNRRSMLGSHLISAYRSLFICSGDDSKMELLFSSYDVTSNSWIPDKVAIGKDYDGAKMISVWNVVLVKKNGDDLFCYLGYLRNGSGGWRNFLHFINPRTHESIKGSPMPSDRITYYAAASYAGKVYVAGGVGAHETTLDSVEVYDVVSDKWHPMPHMMVPRSSFGFQLFVANNCLYAMGGARNTNYAPLIEYLDLGPRGDPHWMQCLSHLNNSTTQVSAAAVWQQAQ